MRAASLPAANQVQPPAAGRPGPLGAACVHFWQMSTTITVRLSDDLAAWLEELARATGVSRGHIVRDLLEHARAAAPAQRRYLRHAGAIKGARDLSERRGFSTS